MPSRSRIRAAGERLALRPALTSSAFRQCNAYAISLLYYLLSEKSGLDWFHAAYALMLALSVRVAVRVWAES